MTKHRHSLKKVDFSLIIIIAILILFDFFVLDLMDAGSEFLQGAKRFYNNHFFVSSGLMVIEELDCPISEELKVELFDYEWAHTPSMCLDTMGYPCRSFFRSGNYLVVIGTVIGYDNMTFALDTSEETFGCENIAFKSSPRVRFLEF